MSFICLGKVKDETSYGVEISYIMMCIWISVVKNPGHLTYFTCMSYGPYYYRTFDGLEYQFGGRCKYTAFTDGIRTVEVGMNNCLNYGSCTKVHYNVFHHRVPFKQS